MLILISLFHGGWGDFDVNIDKDYTLGGSGYLQTKIGHGYEDAGVNVNYLKLKC
jgi:hypothetical protein